MANDQERVTVRVHQEPPAYDGWADLLEIEPRFTRPGFLHWNLNCAYCEGKEVECWQLLYYPERVLAQRSTWPDHWHDGVLRESVNRWAHRAYIGGTLDYAPGTIEKEEGGRLGKYRTLDKLVGKPKGGELALWAWRNSYPLIVGRQALADAINEGDFPRDSLPQRLLNLMPFPGVQYATGVFQEVIADCLVEFFALAEPEIENDHEIVGFQGGDAEFIVRGGHPEHPDIARFIRNARAWWSQFNGQKVKPGRPRGTTKTTASELTEHFRAVMWKNRGHAPTQAEFLEMVQIHADTLKSTLEPAGLWPWETFVNHCRSARTKRV